MNQSRRIFAVVATACLAGAGLSMTACNGGGSHLSSFRSNPTPQMASKGMRQLDIDNRSALVKDHNLRAAYDDLLKAMLLDRPSRLMRPSVY